LRKINELILNNIIEGQIIQFININFDSQVNKISNLNTKNIFVTNDESYNYKFRQTKKTTIRRLQNYNNVNQCDESMAFCLPSNILKEILYKQKSEKLGFNSQLNKNKNIAIKTNDTRKIFSENSLDFEIKVDDSKFKRFRNLNLKELNVNFNIRLKMPELKTNISDIGKSLCVQFEKYKKETPYISCDTWYDYIANEVVCECQNQGLTINLIDETLFRLAILKQFAISTVDFSITFILKYNFLENINKLIP